MLHTISPEKLGPLGAEMTRAIGGCVHCGFCLPACPTYRVLGEEMDSPRGRIFLMKEVLEGHLAVDEVAPYLDRCLGCMACEPACPSGVRYRDLLHPFRDAHQRTASRSLLDRLRRRLLHQILPFPQRFRVALGLARVLRPLAGLGPQALLPLFQLAGLASSRPTGPALPATYPAEGGRRARVALIAGCVQQVLAPGINWATLRVLARNGVEVVIPREQTCCGSLALHDGAWGSARSLARGNLRCLPEDVDAIITTAAGCGSGMKEYPLLFKGFPEESRARAVAEKVQDVAVFLDGCGAEAPAGLSRPLRVAYQDACHLAQAQGITAAPRRLLDSIPNLTLVEVSEPDMCCGSAGTYNVEQPKIAKELGERKARHLLDTGADAVASGNIGCLVQMEAHLRLLGRALPVFHTVELLARAYAGAAGGEP